MFHHFILRSFRLSYLAKDDRVPNALAPGYTVIIIITWCQTYDIRCFREGSYLNELDWLRAGKIEKWTADVSLLAAYDFKTRSLTPTFLNFIDTYIHPESRIGLADDISWYFCPETIQSCLGGGALKFNTEVD